jgi:phenylalanyl-tRNA synthetase beta chain
MKFSFSWVKDLSGYNGSAEKLAELLSMHAFETEVSSGNEFKDIVVAQVTKISKHPNADRLRVIDLTDGMKTYAPVVCGAWNFEVGAIVPLALPGAVIPHDQHDPEGKAFTLSKAVIRGVESQGMICSGKELGITDDGKGILLLTKEYKLGETFSPKGGDIYLDISIPANRPDLLGYLGVAKEVSALTYSKLNFKSPKLDITKFKPKSLKVNIATEKLCHKYIAVRLTNIEVKPSPTFIQERLRNAGLKPINNIVDITNFVMLETGQPLHAFDTGKLSGNINIRTAYVNEQIKTLDGLDRKLSSQNLVIADSKQAIAIAGVMGGANSMIDEMTSDIILESANFESTSVRKTGRELGLRTDAVVRFEKSLPLELTTFAAAYAATLLIQHASAKVLETVVVGKNPKPLKKIKLFPQKVDGLLGFETKPSKQKDILSKLGFKVSGMDPILVVVPFVRADVNIWQDLAEEIARFVGLNEIEEKEIRLTPTPHMTDPVVDLRKDISNYLIALGFTEIYTYSFVSEHDLKDWGVDPKITVEVENPLSADQKYMRTNILMNMLKTADYNERFFDKGNYFEIGKVYWRDGASIIEKMYLGMLCFDKSYPVAKLTSSFREVCRKFGIEVTIDQESEQLATIKSGKKMLGKIGRIPSSGPLWVGLHIDFEEFIKLKKQTIVKPISRYPSIELDVAVFSRKDLQWSKLKQIVNSVGSKLIRSIELFDVYTGKNVPMNKKSIAFRIVYQADNRTLTEDEVTKVHSEILKELKDRLNLEIR